MVRLSNRTQQLRNSLNLQANSSTERLCENWSTVWHSAMDIRETIDDARALIARFVDLEEDVEDETPS